MSTASGTADVPMNGSPAVVRASSDRANMEAALRESEERFRKLAEASPDSIAVVANGKFIYANPKTLELLGLQSLDEIERITPMTLAPLGQRAEISELVERLGRGEQAGPFEIRTTSGPKNREYVFEASVSTTSINGMPATIFYSRDITERVELQAEVMKQDRLASVGMLAAGVAHELNNPLTSLALQTRSLLENAELFGLSESVCGELEQMDEAASRMRQIIGDLLFLARPAEKPQAHVDIAQILTSTIALLRAGSAHVPMDVEFDILPPVYGFPSKLGQVFLNVLRNAAQAVEGRPGGSISIRAERHDEFVEVAIRDNGPGMSAPHLERVATPFFSTKPQGMGLGLWISRSLMNDQGGALELASTEGEGTTVTIRIPQRASVSTRRGVDASTLFAGFGR
ncbi:MAG TPA: ATP-binding protein [Labilithrix sp.]|nr:ATP-binding protein [Labilithrix sp.]